MVVTQLQRSRTSLISMIAAGCSSYTSVRALSLIAAGAILAIDAGPACADGGAGSQTFFPGGADSATGAGGAGTVSARSAGCICTGLGFAARNATDTRSEIGARFDDLTVLNGMPLVLRARAAWAHDWVTDPSLTATFQALPGASFIVNGATPARDSALATASAELRVTKSLSLLARFDGEFASGSQTYAGTGAIKYVW
jgi:hypothetical protein